MKKLVVMALFTVISFYTASVLAGPSCDRKPEQEECITQCEADSTASWCSSLCDSQPDAGHSWCSTESTGGTTSCLPAYDVVSPVTAEQAKIIMQGYYCDGMSVTDLSVMFLAAGLTEAQIQAQIDAKK